MSPDQIMNILLVAAVAAFGLIAGSFLNVVIYRVPRRESIVLPASHCPVCAHSLTAQDNIPVLSYLFLKGRCRYCGAGISKQYPLVEAVAALIFVTSLLKYGLTPAFFPAVFFLLVLLSVSVIDIEHLIIPNVIVLPAIAIAALQIPLFALTKLDNVSLMDQAYWLWPIVGFLIGGGLLFLLALIWPNGMGGGDIKLAALMGLFLGRYVIVALFLGFLLGSVGGITAMSLFGKSRKDLIPFGPYLAGGSLIALYAGAPLVSWYLNISGLG